jgi:hypothetical protein
MAQVGVVLVHGIGTQAPSWADDLARELSARTVAELEGVLAGEPRPEPRHVLAIESVWWADILQEPQRELRRILEAAETSQDADGRWWIRLWRPLYEFLRRKERGFVAEFIGDVIAYRKDAAYDAVHQRLTEALTRLTERLSPPAQGPKAPVTFVAHSLGTVITSNHIWDERRARAARREEGFHERLILANVFTLGSPLALFSLQYGSAEAFRHPIAVETRHGRWINLYDPDDPIAMPLKPLNAAYREAVFRDVRVQSGAYLVAHTRYFRHRPTLALIARKLALDWLALNDRLPAASLAPHFAADDRTLSP